jgi:hypothetical protein
MRGYSVFFLFKLQVFEQSKQLRKLRVCLAKICTEQSSGLLILLLVKSDDVI